MGYLQDFYPLHITYSYIEYVISALKYDDNDILFLDVHKLVNIAQRFHTFDKFARFGVSTKELKIFRVIPL